MERSESGGFNQNTGGDQTSFGSSGIATVSVEAGVDVRLKDASFEALGRGLRHAREVFEERRRRGSLKPREVDRRMQRLSPTVDYSGFRRADLVIEAVFEDLDLKRRVLAETEPHSPAEDDDLHDVSGTSSSLIAMPSQSVSSTPPRSRLAVRRPASTAMR